MANSTKDNLGINLPDNLEINESLRRFQRNIRTNYIFLFYFAESWEMNLCDTNVDMWVFWCDSRCHMYSKHLHFPPPVRDISPRRVFPDLDRSCVAIAIEGNRRPMTKTWICHPICSNVATPIEKESIVVAVKKTCWCSHLSKRIGMKRRLSCWLYGREKFLGRRSRVKLEAIL